MESREELLAFFDKNYFENADSDGYGGYGNHEWYVDESKKLYDFFNKPESVFDFGCAKGCFVANFASYGCDAYGIDASMHAILDPVPGAGGKILQGTDHDLDMFRDNSFDLVISFATLEHLFKEDSIKAFAELVRLSKKYLYVTIPFIENESVVVADITGGDKSHVNIQYKKFWLEQFKKHNLKILPFETEDPYSFALEKQ